MLYEVHDGDLKDGFQQLSSFAPALPLTLCLSNLVTRARRRISNMLAKRKNIMVSWYHVRWFAEFLK